MTTQSNERGVPQWTMGDRLRKAREVTGLNQRDFAGQLGVSHQTVTNAEKGHRGVRKITLNAWALATGVPVEWLESGEGTTRPSGPTPPDGGQNPDRQRQLEALAASKRGRGVSTDGYATAA